MSHKIAPSLLSADFLNLQRDIEMINRSEADWLHDLVTICVLTSLRNTGDSDLSFIIDAADQICSG